MKKALVFLLAVVMVMSMAVPAAALASPAAKPADLAPVLTKESQVIVELHTTEEVMSLSAEVQELMAAAKESLKDVCPKGFAVKYFFYVEIIGSDDSVSITFEPFKYKEIVFMQFVDGEWVELEYVVNEDGTITVFAITDGPIVVFYR